MTKALVVLTTVEKAEDGERLARLLVESELAACVQVLPPMTSIYRWEGKIEHSRESLLLIKSTVTAYDTLEAAIRQNHPYQTPEIIAIKVEGGSKNYLDWLANSVKSGM
jgi:periplasmic divalent cation tolerance protein